MSLSSVLDHPQGLTTRFVQYTALANQIRSDGYRVESYIFPFIYDERRANSQLLELLFGLVDVTAVDDEIPLLYTSGLPLGLGFLKSYGKGLKSVGKFGDPVLKCQNCHECIFSPLLNRY